MPLIKSKSKKAFQENFKQELDSGAPKKQSLAIAYAVQRRTKKSHGGGMVSDGDAGKPKMSMEPMGKHQVQIRMAQGGIVSPSLAERIMNRKKMEQMPPSQDDGMADDHDEYTQSSILPEQQEAASDSHYGDDLDLETPMDGDQMGGHDDFDDNDLALVDKIYRKMKRMRGDD